MYIVLCTLNRIFGLLYIHLMPPHSGPTIILNRYDDDDDDDDVDNIHI